MSRALRQTMNFFRRLGRKFYEARQVKAQRTVKEHLHFYRYSDRIE